MSISEKSCDNSEVSFEENAVERRRRTVSDICIAFEDEKNREFTLDVEKKSDCGSYDFDSKSVDGKLEPLKNFKMYICKSVQNSKECPYGKKCKFSHNEEELVTKSCTHGKDCTRIEIKNGIVVNRDKKNLCIFIHPRETISSFLRRKGLNGFPDKEDKNDSYKCTRMCVSYSQNIKCLKGDDCTYAHNVNELKTTPCNFKDKCNNVRRKGKQYINHGQKLCVFLHPDESLDNYYTRALSGNKPEKKYLKHKKSDSEEEDEEEDEDEDEEDEEEDEDDEKIIKNKTTEITLKIYEKDVTELLTIVLTKIKIHNFSVKS